MRTEQREQAHARRIGEQSEQRGRRRQRLGCGVHVLSLHPDWQILGRSGCPGKPWRVLLGIVVAIAFPRATPVDRRRTAAVLGLWVLGLMLVTRDARAETPVSIATPNGWSDRDPDPRALARASGWLAERPDARLGVVLTPDSRDEFPEVLATIAIDGVFDEHAAPELELDRAIDRMLPYEPELARITAVPAQGLGPQQVRAGWTSASVAYRVALVPSGTTRTLMVLATLASEAPLYERTFDAALVSMQGAAAPQLPFDHARWRVLALLAWCVPAALLLALAAWRKPVGFSMVWVGRSFALACLLAALVAGWVVHDRMLERTGELRLAGISPATISAETISYGIATALVCWIVGSLLARRERPVVSAPSSGVFAGRSQSSASMQIPIITRIEKQVPRHPDGPSRLDPVTDPPGGSLRAVEPGVEPRDFE
ncbi:MAG: hypothetical protein IAG13_36180 [Deltaproteobacteria bacterium]|nr:hypothetical protein [Nannocystaceae bacterium]